MKNKRLLAVLILMALICVVCFFIPRLLEADKPGVAEKQSAESSDTEISAVIIPHHDLDKSDRRALFSRMGDSIKDKTIILVSTNHFDTGNSNILTTKKQWNLSNGAISPDEGIIDALVESGLALSHENSFADEHGIKNILPDIADFFPKAEIVPIIIKPGTKKEDIDKLSETLMVACKNDCLFAGSVDFSHYQPGSLAEIHDDLSIRALTNLDTALLSRAEVDSRETLYLAVEWAKANATEQFNLFKNTNSGKIENNRDGESTSYVLGWYQNGETSKLVDSFTFMIGGDMMFDRGIEYNFQGKKLKDVMENFGDRVFSGTDLSLVNLEGPISPVPLLPSNKESLVFNFQPETASVLSWLGVNGVSLANNHTLNNGKAGLTNTKKVLTDIQISYVGQDAAFNEESIKTFDNGGDIKLTVMTIDCLNTTTDLAGAIKKQKDLGNLVLIVPHWGAEYEQIHSMSQENLAHSWIDHGADFVIGGHPHVIQDAETYKGKPIFYSLGNLLFDQNFSIETQRGLILAVKINKDKTELVLLPTISKKHQPELLVGSEKTGLIKKFRKYLGAPEVDPSYGYDKIELAN